MASASEGLPVHSPVTTTSTGRGNESNSPSPTPSPAPSTPKSPDDADKWPSLVVSRDSMKLSAKKRKARKYRDPVVIERSNLVNITKLVVKELIESSLKYGRMLDIDHVPLQHFFIVLEHVMRHGLKPKKGLLGPKKELWDVLQAVEKLCMEAQDITVSVRDLPTVSTHLGRARAWLRLALMQKKLADYFKVLLDHRDDCLAEFYEPSALMMCDESVFIMGLLVGLNVIDCNFCVKEEDLDCQQGVIDFSLYLRSNSHKSDDSPDEDLDTNNMTTVLDQKNYIEELNRHLNATVTNLQAKVETLTTTNALMKEDLAIAKNSLLSLQDENIQLKKKLGLDPDACVNIEEISIDTSYKNKGDAKLDDSELQKQLEEERQKKQEAEKELHLQISLKAEMEVAMKLLEKDIHEKQDTIISLRRQLDDIKLINLEMYKKLQECEGSLKHKADLIAKLERKSTSMADTMQKLEEKNQDAEQNLEAAHESLRNMGQQVADKEIRSSTLEGDLRVEKEWRQSLQDTLVRDREKIAELMQKTQALDKKSKDYEILKAEHLHLVEQCREHEKTLAELGVHLSESKLKVEDMKEASRGMLDAQWAPDKEATNCRACTKEFNITRRKHHCRNCGDIYCHQCSDNTMQLPSSAKPVRVCDDCYTLLLQRYTSAPSTTP